MFENLITLTVIHLKTNSYKHLYIVLTLFAGDVYSQHCDGDVVFIGAHVLQDSGVQLSLKLTEEIRREAFSKGNRTKRKLWER